MEQLRILLGDIWRSLPLAGLANEYHPCTEGGVIPVPFIQAQKLLIESILAGTDNNPALERPKRSFTSYMQGYSSLPLRDRALICLRSAHLSNARHLMPAIASMALDHGLRSSDVQLICNGRFALGWSRWDHTLICATDELFKRQSISPKLWRILMKKYSPRQIFDLVLCSAAFHLCVSD
ncbi:hypothetical protein ACH42_15810 [Endozoicomonas sp. (ex Bugula neritina AB1)]|nr:hypothetical protein ACH42_15810 [Endozoicomonas sp. (ex Bugula neritina AB1)]